MEVSPSDLIILRFPYGQKKKKKSTHQVLFIFSENRLGHTLGCKSYLLSIKKIRCTTPMKKITPEIIDLISPKAKVKKAKMHTLSFKLGHSSDGRNVNIDPLLFDAL